MPWTAHIAHAGFSPAQPWLPVSAAHKALAVDRQMAAEDSVLAFCRHFLTWRRNQPALRRGTIRFVAAPTDVLAFWREDADQRLLVAINLGVGTANLDTPAIAATRELAGHGFNSDCQAGALTLPPYGAYFGLAE
jgi:alpha-glucosidase